MKPLITAIYMRKLAIFERKLLDPVTGAVVLWEMFESCLYPWSGLWWLHKCLQACCYLAECRIYSSWFKRSWPLISEVLTGLFSLLHKENSFKYLFYLFYFFFLLHRMHLPLSALWLGVFLTQWVVQTTFSKHRTFLLLVTVVMPTKGPPWVLPLTSWWSEICPHPKAFTSSSVTATCSTCQLPSNQWKSHSS